MVRVVIQRPLLLKSEEWFRKKSEGKTKEAITVILAKSDSDLN